MWANRLPSGNSPPGNIPLHLFRTLHIARDHVPKPRALQLHSKCNGVIHTFGCRKQFLSSVAVSYQEVTSVYTIFRLSGSVQKSAYWKSSKPSSFSLLMISSLFLFFSIDLSTYSTIAAR